MQDETIGILTKYISAWGWQIISIIFLGVSLISFSIPRSISSGIFFVSSFLLFLICQYNSFIRRRELIETNETIEVSGRITNE